MLSRTTKWTFAVALLLGLSSAGFAQDGWRRDGDGDDGYSNRESREHNKFYRQGLHDGHEDREHGRAPYIRNRGWDDPEDRNVYLAGYRAGYGQDAYFGRGRDDAYYGRDDSRGQYGGQAYQIGYQDGLRNGSQDRATGHSYRPTHDDDYHHADRGYSSYYGSKQAYKDTYRDGYRAGYDRGYNSRY